MKKWFVTVCICAFLLSCVTPALATQGNVTYSGDAGEFLFAPGSEYSPTDLFANFKDVMPGDSIVQPITVKNDASKRVKVNIYLRALGAHEDSVEFLSRLRLRVEKHENNSMAYMFDAAANETAQLTDWVLLGTLYSGGEVRLDVILDVPVELDNRYQRQIGLLDWEFRIVEMDISATDPEPPKTGDDATPWLWALLLALSVIALALLLKEQKRAHRKEK